MTDYMTPQTKAQAQQSASTKVMRASGKSGGPVGAPKNPTKGASYTGPKGASWKFNGKKWVRVGSGVAPWVGSAPSPGAQPQWNLTPDEIAGFDARRIALDEELQSAEAMFNADSQAVNAGTVARMTDLLRQFGAQREAGIGELSGRGLALSPAHAMRFLNALNEQRAAELAGAESSRVAQIDRLSNSLDAVKQRRLRGIAELNRDQTAAGTRLSTLMPGVRYS